MPPARKTVCPYPVVTDTAAKSRWPRHVINIQDLHYNKNDNDKYHLVLKIDEFSPEQISIKRNGNTLKVDSARNDENCVGEGVEHITRSYEIPKGGYTEEFGAQISVDGLLGVRNKATQKMTGRVIPINIDRLPQLKPGTVFHLNTAEWQKACPVKITYLDKSGVQHTQQMELKKEEEKGGEDNEEQNKVHSQLPVNNNDQEMEVTGANAEDSEQGGLPDESVQI